MEERLAIRLEKRIAGEDPVVSLYQIVLESPDGEWRLEPTTSREVALASLRTVKAVLSMLGVSELDLGGFELEVGPRDVFPEKGVGHQEVSFPIAPRFWGRPDAVDEPPQS